MIRAIGMTSTAIGTGTSSVIAAAMAPMSAPALIVFAITRPDTVR